MINYSFNVDKFIKHQSLFVQSLNEYFRYYMNSLPSLKNWYSVTIHINSIQNRWNSLCLTEYHSYLITAVKFFITLAPGVDRHEGPVHESGTGVVLRSGVKKSRPECSSITLFSLSLNQSPNKLERLFLASLILAVRVGAYL